MTASEIKFCKDCKWCSGGICERSVSLVTGSRGCALCREERGCGMPCGPDAKLFEPKE